MKRYGEALDVLDKAIAIDPKWAELYFLRAGIHVRESASEIAETPAATHHKHLQSVESAVEDLRTFSRLQPDAPDSQRVKETLERFEVEVADGRRLEDQAQPSVLAGPAPSPARLTAPADTTSKKIGLAARWMNARAIIRHTDLLGLAEPEPPEERKPSSTGQKAFGCTHDIISPTVLGWCQHGAVFAPAHVGWLGLLAGNDGDAYVGAQAAGYLFTGGNFWGAAQASVYADVGGHFNGVAQGGLLIFDGKDFRGGVQAPFLWAHVGGDFYGVGQTTWLWGSVAGRFVGLLQVSPAAATGGDFFGAMQGGGVYSEVGGTFGGIGQAAAVARVDGSFYGGAQSAFVFNYVGGNFGGLAQGATVNYVGGTFYGPAQVAGAFNWVHGDVDALVQTTWVYNRVDGTLRSSQVGLINTAGHVRGVQIGAAVNWSGDLVGAQLSIVNLATRVRGVQVGVFNWTRELSGLQLGIFNMPGEHGVPLPIANLGWH